MVGMSRTILPDADALHLEEILAEGEAITVVASTARDSACCPDCGRASRRIHSHRRRVVADLPWQGLAVRLEPRFRRFYCETPACARATFTESLPTVARRYARRTARLAMVVEGAPARLAARAARACWPTWVSPLAPTRPCGRSPPRHCRCTRRRGSWGWTTGPS